MGHTALVLGDQLSHDNPALEGAGRVLLVESRAALARHPYHRQRLHLVLSAMRHFAAELRERDDVDVDVVERRGVASFAEALRGEREVLCTEPTSGRTRRHLEGHGVRFVAGGQFLTSPEDFAAWAGGRRRLLMEDFYRDQRRRHDVLMTPEGEPEGGRWNFDADNRRPPPRDGLRAPAPWTPGEDAIDVQVRRDLDRAGLHGWGVDAPRAWPATRGEALAALDDFVQNRLSGFGPWQDAMVPGERTMFHSRLSSSLNLWLLEPLEVVRAVQDAHRDGGVPLQSAEGFVRQVIGWREYVWGMYWLREREWPRRNALRARRALPAAYRDSATTEWNCLRSVVRSVEETGYAHHIERLMILGNILLLLGVRPWEAVEWFQAAFIDGAEWVMAPNASGMALWADGGEMMTKPYAAGGNYVNRMSRYCGECRFDPRRRTGPDACPLTALYWDFIERNGEHFAGNARMRMPLRTLARMDEAERHGIRRRAREAHEEAAGRA